MSESHEAKLQAEIAKLKAEQDEQRKLLDENIAILDGYIHEIHKLEGELEYARGKKLVAERDAAYIKGMERAALAIEGICARLKNYDALSAVAAEIDKVKAGK